MVFDIEKEFETLCKSDTDKSEAVAAIEVLTKILKYSDVTTIQGLHEVMNVAISKMCENDLANISVKSGCELFERFITLATLDTVDFNDCKKVLSERAHIFIRKVGLCRQHISEIFLNYIPNGAKIFLNSYSRVVLSALAHATRIGGGKQVHCYVTTSMPSGSGAKMTKALAKLKIPCTLVPDTAIAYLMPQVDFVVLGAEAVVESGGILNILGSSLIAMIASAFRRPVYVLAESFKFIRCYPLDQRHIPDEFKGCHSSDLVSLADGRLSQIGSPLQNLRIEHGCHNRTECDGDDCDDDDDDEGFPEMNSNWNLVMKERVSVIEQKMPRVDYTSPSYITYLVTDLGVLTPSAVSDELIKLYL